MDDETFPEEDEAIEMAIREAEEIYQAATAQKQLKPSITASSDTEQQQQQQQCTYCGTLSTDDRLLRDFGLAVCYPCKMAHKEEFRCVSKGKAKKEYLLNDDQIAKLRSATVHNPTKVGWHDMKLYLVSQVQKEAARVWGSLGELEEEKKRRAEARLNRGAKKRQQQKNRLTAPLETSSGSLLIEKEIKRQRIQAALGEDDEKATSNSKKKKNALPPLPDVFVKTHEHKFGPSRENGSNEVVQQCLECGLEVVSEIF